MTEQQDDGFGAVLAQWLFKKYDQTMAGLKTCVKVTLWLLVILAALSFVLELTGIKAENNDFVSMGRIVRAICSLIIFIIVLMIAIAIKAVTRAKFSLDYYMRLVAHFFLFQLIIAFAIQVSPMPVSASLLLTVTFATCLLAIALAISNKLMLALTATALVGTILAIYFPKYGEMASEGIRDANRAQLLKFQHGDFKDGQIECFKDGRVKIWFDLRKEKYVLYGRAGHSSFGKKKLEPITEDICTQLSENEDLISPRNFISSSETNEKASQKPPVADSPKPEAPVSESEKTASSGTSESIVAIPAPNTPSKIDHSTATPVDLPGNWSVCLGPDGSRICGDGKIKDNRFTSDKIILRDNGINSDKITFDFESLSKISFGSETGSLRWIDKSFAVGSLGGKKVALAEFR